MGWGVHQEIVNCFMRSPKYWQGLVMHLHLLQILQNVSVLVFTASVGAEGGEAFLWGGGRKEAPCASPSHFALD